MGELNINMGSIVVGKKRSLSLRRSHCVSILDNSPASTLKTSGKIFVMRIVQICNRQNFLQHRDVPGVCILVISIWHLHELHLVDLRGSNEKKEEIPGTQVSL